ncbi:hypothetical protein HO173_007415 [Letharia columbiana]|uniref:Major facilitator superfamily (MFS) profile domain-containing protein n=1 Tax=Letharia columbiana TaxID=112416 RepID=A0A8H6L3P2_9LECA|nr:uncharacterized protein HO173_007415 [Letharia columbiana]KAF6234382.1 hypothetical protein HO173_007415 [Letharia columbiana]
MSFSTPLLLPEIEDSPGDRLHYQNGHFRDPEMEGLTLYEKKALLVNRELDSHGMGKYQWYIFFLCGFGYLVDLLYAQAFGLVEPAMQQEFGFGPQDSGHIFSSFSAGLTAGAFVWGVLVDIIGRQYAFNLTVLISSVFGLCLAAPSTYNGVLVLTAFVGFGVGGNIPIDTTICLEFLPQNRRFLLAMLSIFQPLGVVISSGIAYGFIPFYSCGNGADQKPLPACSSSTLAPGAPCCTKASNMGWRYTLICLGAICVTIFFLRFVVFRFQESPKFLLYRDRDDKAVEVLQKIAKFNGRESSITLESFEALTNEHASMVNRDTDMPIPNAGMEERTSTWVEKIKIELQRCKILFSTFPLARLTILVWITYIFDYWGFSIAGSFLPTILLQKNKAIDISTAETYRNFVIIYVCGIPGVMLGTLMYVIPRVGRKWAMVGSSALMGISLFLFATVNTEASNIGLNAMEYFFQSMFNAVLYGWTPEVFPAPIRGTASGLASFWGRLFSIVSPLIAADLLSKSVNGPLYLAGSGVFVSTIALVLMPTKSMGAQSY